MTIVISDSCCYCYINPSKNDYCVVERVQFQFEIMMMVINR